MTKPTDTELALIERQHAVTLDPEVRGRIVRDQMQPGDAEAFRDFETARRRAKRRALHDDGRRCGWREAVDAMKAARNAYAAGGDCDASELAGYDAAVADLERLAREAA